MTLKPLDPTTLAFLKEVVGCHELTLKTRHDLGEVDNLHVDSWQRAENNILTIAAFHFVDSGSAFDIRGFMEAVKNAT